MDIGLDEKGRIGQTASVAGPMGLLTLAATLGLLYFLSRTNYLLFHSIVESFSIIVACGVFMVAWNSRRFHENGFFLCLGVGALCVAVVDFLHTLAYKNMGVFPSAGANLPTQLWIAARYLEAAAFLLAPLLLTRRARPTPLFCGFLAATALLLAAVFGGFFPDCFREPSGLTPFKIVSEYLICLMIGGSVVLLHRQRRAFDPGVLRLLFLAAGVFILAELSFTLYTDVFGVSNMVGHLFKVAGFYFIYRGVIETGLTRPYDLLFRELKMSEERYRSLYKKTPVMLHSIDREGRLMSVSDYWLEHLGYARQEVIGHPVTDLFTESSRRYALERALPDFFRTGACQDLAYQVVKKDGETIDVHLSATTERDEKGEFIRSLAVMVDVTERKRSEEELQSSKDRLTAALGIAQLGIWEYDGAADLIHFDERSRDVFGLPDDRPLSREEVLALLHPDDRPRVEDQVNRALDPRGSGLYETEYRIIRYDGRLKWVAVRGHATRSGKAAAGKHLHFVGTMMDITARKQAEAAIEEARIIAEEANRAKSEFLANMCHEIRTPMTVFVSAIEQLLQLDENPEGRQLLGMADRSARRLRRLIDDILDLSRIEARRFELDEEPFDLPVCVREAVDIFSHLAREKNLRLETEIAPDTPHSVVGDPNRLGQVLINLVGNAVKFTDQGVIRISVRPRGDLLEIAVADTGIGIPEEKHELIFQEFRQVDSSFTRRFGGTGLGLTITKGLVDLMGGELSVQSREGEGSVFTFTVSMRIAEIQSLAPAISAHEDAETEKPAPNILLAEDDPMIRKIFTIMLAKHGWQAETAESGKEAVEKSAGGDFDIILMDLQMPEMNGIEATRAIRERELQGGKRTCIIGLTAHGHREVHVECLASGMDKVLTKPIQMKDLILALGDSCS